MKLDSNRAWKDASRSVSRNRDAMLAVAGVFFLLPQLALGLFFPQPEPAVGMSEMQIVQLVQSYYLSTLPVLLPMILCQALGTIALLTLLRHATRPTVGEALRLGLSGLFPYIAAQMLVSIGVVMAGGLVLSVLVLTGVQALAAAGVLLVLAAAAAVLLRVSLSAAVIAQGERNPVRALQRSWALTAGNAWRLLSFYALFFVSVLVIQMVAGIFVGIPARMLASPATSALVMAVITSVLNALMALYLVAIVGAVHAQLSGTADGDEQRTFA